MKSFLQKTFVLLLLVTFSSYAQDTAKELPLIPTAQVPQPVIEMQQRMFPGEMVLRWRKQELYNPLANDSIVHYISNIRIGGANKLIAFYQPEGNLILTSEYLEEIAMDSQVLLKVQSEFRDFNIQYAELIKLVEPQIELYKVILRNNALVKHAYYRLNGEYIRDSEVPDRIRYLTGN